MYRRVSVPREALRVFLRLPDLPQPTYALSAIRQGFSLTTAVGLIKIRPN